MVGELAIPFIALSLAEYVELYHHNDQCQQFYSVCKALILKARLVGCSLIWPEDVLIAEEPLKDAERTKCDLVIIPDARNEGADYEGEVRTVNLKAIVDSTVAKKEPIIPGYIYDIGPDSTKSLQFAIQSADIAVFWGTIGVCEVNNFQFSQHAILQAITGLKPPNPSGGAVPLNNGVNIILWGEKTVEWFTRLGDPDGELQGDLVRNGSTLTYANRDSTIFSGMVGRFPSTVVQDRLLYRSSLQGEWIYINRKQEELDEEEEEDEEEEDEDD